MAESIRVKNFRDTVTGDPMKKDGMISKADVATQNLLDIAGGITKVDKQTDAILKAAYRGAAADGRISPKEIILLDKFAAKSEGEFSAAYQGAAADDGINLDEIRLLNEMLGVKDSFTPAKE